MDEKFYIFPRFGRFPLDSETLEQLGIPASKRVEGLGLRWFNWTIATVVDQKPGKRRK